MCLPVKWTKISFSSGYWESPSSTCRIQYGLSFIFLAERARASVAREMVILARLLTIKGGNIDLKH